MKQDPYKNYAALYDYVVSPLNFSLNKARKILTPPARDMKVLDVGCGTGADLELYHQAGCDVAGVDISPAMLNVARRKFGDAADLRLCDAAQLPFQDGSFDLILSTYTLHEMPQSKRPAVIREMLRVLNDNGRILITEFAPGPYSFPVGWIHRASILIFENIAGREHLNNGLEFLKSGGVPELIQPFDLEIKKKIMVGGRTTGFYLLKTS
jgi:ubiquinone/menaquinone biosynthesis C-methylase UbiE